jgi:lipopolysaccharide export LptBFGC system permease protein LptF
MRRAGWPSPPYNAAVRIRINRYIVSEVLGPMGLGFLVYTFILLLRFLFQSAEMIIRRGLAVSVVGKLLLVTLPNIVVLTLPMSLLFGILIAVGRLSSDSELTALRSCGISLLSLYRPVLMVSAVFTFLNVLLMIYVLPWGNRSLQELRLQILTQTMSQQVEPRVFYEEWVGKSIYVFEAPGPGHRWKGVFLAETDPNTTKSEITVADWGEIKVDQSGEHVVLRADQRGAAHGRPQPPRQLRDQPPSKSSNVVLEDQFTSEQKAKMAQSKGIRELTLPSSASCATTPRRRPRPATWHSSSCTRSSRSPPPASCSACSRCRSASTTGAAARPRASRISIGIIDRLLHHAEQRRGREHATASSPHGSRCGLPNILLAVTGFYVLLRRNRDKRAAASGASIAGCA